MKTTRKNSQFNDHYTMAQNDLEILTILSSLYGCAESDIIDPPAYLFVFAASGEYIQVWGTNSCMLTATAYLMYAYGKHYETAQHIKSINNILDVGTYRITVFQDNNDLYGYRAEMRGYLDTYYSDTYQKLGDLYDELIEEFYLRSIDDLLAALGDRVIDWLQEGMTIPYYHETILNFYKDVMQDVVTDASGSDFKEHVQSRLNDLDLINMPVAIHEILELACLFRNEAGFYSNLEIILDNLDQSDPYLDLSKRIVQAGFNFVQQSVLGDLLSLIS